MKLSIDIETYSSVDIAKSGVYPYVESQDFEILLFAYAFNDEKVRCIDMAQGESIPEHVVDALYDDGVTKHAYNAMFERICLNEWLISKYGEPEQVAKCPRMMRTYIDQWYCTMVHAYMAGYSGSLEAIGKAMGLAEDKNKMRSGKALINYFSKPCKPTKANGGRTRNLPEHDIDKWQQFKKYCIRDVKAEREIYKRLLHYKIPKSERKLYVLDQKINDRGVLIDKPLVASALDCNKKQIYELTKRAKHLTGLENPNSTAQLKTWIETNEGISVPSLGKDNLPQVLGQVKRPQTREVLNIRKSLSKTSIKKYQAMDSCIRRDGRAGGLLQYYGASRTGRWAGRLIQVQNLPKNKITDLDDARNFLRDKDYEAIDILYPSVQHTLSQLVRTAFIAKDGHTFAVADFSAIEARVIAWLAGEMWRLDVFSTHGKIYEASASAMFHVPIESIDKNSPLRQKGKIAELALGYGGSVGALMTMGALDMGLDETELQPLVDSWRAANQRIVRLWKILDAKAKSAISMKCTQASMAPLKGVRMYTKQGDLRIVLPSGRELCYLDARLVEGRKFGNVVVSYIGKSSESQKLVRLETYGGKITENVIQAIARDCLGYAMLRLGDEGYEIVMHVHDEVIIEIPQEGAVKHLEKICEVMGESIPWAKGLPLRADGYITKYYLKD